MSLRIDSSERCEHSGGSKQFVTNGSDVNEVNLGYVMFTSLKKYSNRVLQYLADTNEEDTYGEVLKRSIRTALKLIEKGVSRDDIISTCSHNHKNNVVPLIATLFIGAKVANIDPNLSLRDAIYLLKLLKPKIIFVAQESLSFMEKCLKESEIKTELVVFGHSESYTQFSEYLQPNSSEDDFKPARIDDSLETVMIYFSSGTTGFPKGICVNHYGFLRQSVNDDIVQIGDCGEDNVNLIYATYYWMSATIFLFKCVSSGSAKVVCSKFDALNTWKIIEKYKVTSLFMGPYQAAEFVSYRKNFDTSSLQYLYTGSCPVTKNLMHDLNEALPNTTILNAYGQTETSGSIAVFDAKNPEEIDMQIRKPMSCGKVTKKYAWKVVDPTSEELLPPNQTGELRVKCDFFMNGYYKIDSSSVVDSQGYFKTGDIVYYDDDECIYVVDRIKEMFKYRGWYILPAVLEKVIMTHPAVKEAVVIGVPHEIDGELPMGLVVLHKEHEDVTANDIEQYVEKRVTDVQKLRAGVKIIKEIVRTATEKIRRNHMKKMVLDGLI